MEQSKSTKRKLPFSGLQRRVRARREEPAELEQLSSGPSEESNAEDEEQSDEEDASPADDSSSASEDEDADEEQEAPGQSLDIATVSLGALAKAQAAFPSVRKKKHHKKSSGDSSESDDSSPREVGPRVSTKKPIPTRANKHAPTEQTSKRAVTRKREIITIPKAQARDPRFMPPSSSLSAAQDAERQRRNYAFLADYRDSEMATLRATIKKTKDAAAKEQLQRALMSMQSRKQAQQRKDEERTVIEDHRRQEKELVKDGKTPFYLKKSEQKKRILLDRFAGMKGKQVDRVIEKKRKKTAAKERKDMPWARRER